jgi:predicted membrane GTPase involved in stress response
MSVNVTKAKKQSNVRSSESGFLNYLLEDLSIPKDEYVE